MMDLFEMAPTFDDPLGMLRACHRRIERALTVMERVAEAERDGPLHGPVQETLRQTLIYFATGVPRHAKDEEESLFPRLRAALSRDDLSVLSLLKGLEKEHVMADSAHQQLEALGQKLLETGRFQTAEERTRFGELISTLRQLYQEHIDLEDNELFPVAAALVDAGEQEAIGAEMAGRRGIDWGKHRQVIAQLESRPWIHRPTRGTINHKETSK